MKRFGWGNILFGLGAVLLLVAAVLYLAPSDDYILLPENAKQLEPLVQVEGEKPDRNGGGIYYVAVDVRKASLLEKAFPGIHEGSTLIPAHEFNPTGEDDRTRRREDLRDMAQSQKFAAAVALRQLGYKVQVRNRGVLIEAVAADFPATGKLQAGDVVVALDGKPVRSVADLRRLMAPKKPGDEVRLTLTRDGETSEVTLKTVANPKDPKQAFLGVVISDDAEVEKLPVGVKINLGNVGGPSAGLAFALDLVDELGRDVDHGNRVAATGEIELDGSIRPVGGIKQKTIGARRSGMDLFLVPGENAAEARRYADGLRIIPVDSFQQALRELATAAPNA
ncbi:MAG TPA: PDZ domain-containing protein [Gaiellaceae bacterium]|nr:PDZ domain-containing protein [Gaiellaceae bacterium]